MQDAFDPLDEEPLDPLDEAAYEPLDDMPRGGSSPDQGFAATVTEARGRAIRLAAVPRARPSVRNVISQKRRRAFLRALAATGNVSLAAARAGWSRGCAVEMRKTDKAFAEQWEAALEVAADIVDAAVFQRAVHGVEEEVVRLDKMGNPVVCGTVTRYSDPLLIHLSKAVKPEKYRERHEVQHTASKGGVLLLPAAVPLDQWEAAAAAQQAQYRERVEPE